MAANLLYPLGSSLFPEVLTFFVLPAYNQGVSYAPPYSLDYTMKSLRIGCQLYLYTITMSTYKQQTCHLYATSLNKKILTRDISTIKRTGIPSRVVLTQFSFLFLLISIKSVKYNFFFSLLININLILYINWSH